MVKLYKVGGAVRDELLGVAPSDIDYAVEAADFAEMRAFLADRPATSIFLEKAGFGTIRAKNRDTGEVIDYTLCRKDGRYSDRRRPDSIEATDILTDLARRDFTINAIAVDAETGALLDPHKGADDIRRGLIRCVGAARDRMAEDPLRLLRAFRFSVTKDFTICDSIRELFGDAEFAPLLRGVAVERRLEELRKAFEHDTARTLRLLSELPPEFVENVFHGGLWLLPTTRRPKRAR
uniref:Poly A polymerase head domain protein n=1 Tax=Marseillevirus LCMAC103 TaxID=2506604 RepID=A0A481YWS2_9VIRU|nr:MAG: poly A polymerase head domain protein [Marseillevirus LCMAC103]